ncbi:hypothetical protein FN846DRAFT_913539 [Sphaerosporella brunnea]|uniref:Uncharacterized protein n=1 Tax=Sphaerosporella brunnea TaxID=1250544 RepID=A0A5J5EGJ0_9PEZI|nr:hypothetical protein FN846DRAFT_913539 [Sphaerosporella brunnea]
MASIAFDIASMFFLPATMVLATQNPLSNLFGRAIQTAQSLLQSLDGGMAANLDLAVKRYSLTFDNMHMVERLIACNMPTLGSWPGRVWWLCYCNVCAGFGLVINRPGFAGAGWILALFFELMAREEHGNVKGWMEVKDSLRMGTGTGDAAAARRASAGF